MSDELLKEKTPIYLLLRVENVVATCAFIENEIEMKYLLKILMIVLFKKSLQPKNMRTLGLTSRNRL